MLGRGRASRDAHALDTFEPRRVDFLGVVDEVSPGATILSYFSQALRVGTIVGAQDENQSGPRSQALHGSLAVLCGVADVVARGRHQFGEAPPQNVDDGVGIVHTQSGLSDDGNALRIRHLSALRLVRRTYKLDVAGDLTHRSGHFFVALMSYENDRAAFVAESYGLEMNLGDEGARGVNYL